MIITGPRATLGRLFKTTRKGSATLEIKSDHHKIMAIIIPRSVPIKNPTIVSYVVTQICFNKLLDVKLRKVFNILLGWLVIKLSMIFLFAKNSHIAKNPTNTVICVSRMRYFLCFSFFKYCFRSVEI